jgi:hypothetical protein
MGIEEAHDPRGGLQRIDKGDGQEDSPKRPQEQDHATSQHLWKHDRQPKVPSQPRWISGLVCNQLEPKYRRLRGEDNVAGLFGRLPLVHRGSSSGLCDQMESSADHPCICSYRSDLTFLTVRANVSSVLPLPAGIFRFLASSNDTLVGLCDPVGAGITEDRVNADDAHLSQSLQCLTKYSTP